MKRAVRTIVLAGVLRIGVAVTALAQNEQGGTGGNQSNNGPNQSNDGGNQGAPSPPTPTPPLPNQGNNAQGSNIQGANQPGPCIIGEDGTPYNCL